MDIMGEPERIQPEEQVKELTERIKKLSQDNVELKEFIKQKEFKDRARAKLLSLMKVDERTKEIRKLLQETDDLRLQIESLCKELKECQEKLSINQRLTQGDSRNQKEE